MISCLPSLYLAQFAVFKAFAGRFSAVALMEAREQASRCSAKPCPGTSSFVCKHFYPNCALVGAAQSAFL